MKGRKGNRAAREKKTDPARRRKVLAAKPTTTRKALQATELRATLAQARAQQFAATAAAVELPPFMANDPQYAGAKAIWEFHAPLLRDRNFWEPEFIAPFTGFCIYYDEFLAADREVKDKGWGVEGKSTNGGNRFWRNPAVDVRDHAFSRVMELSSRYAFTPMDMYRLERESAAANMGGKRAPPPSATPAPPPAAGEQLPLEAAAADAAGGPGSMVKFDGAPPGRPN
jgi:phage terminase small subunit